MRKGTIKLSLGIAAGLFALAALAQQMGLVTVWSTKAVATTQAESAVMADPVNDECASATALTVNFPGCPGGTQAPTAGTTIDADNSVLRPLASCHFPGGVTAANANDVWYSFTVSAANAGLPHTVTVVGAANFDAVVAAYTSCAAANNIALACADNTAGGGVEAFTFTPGAAGTYFIRVYDWSAVAPIGGDFTIQVSRAPAAPANDLCANATAVAVGGTNNGTNIGSTADPLFADCGGLSLLTRPVVHYTTAIPQTGNGENNVSLNTNGSDFDTYIVTHTGGCNAAAVCLPSAGASSFDGNSFDDDDGTGLQSDVQVTATTTVTVRTLVGGFGGAVGCITFNAVQLPSIQNVAAGGIGACNVASNTYQQEFIVTYAGVANGQSFTVNGVSFVASGSPQSIVLSLPANDATSAALNFTSVAGNTGISAVSINVPINAPEPCEPCVMSCSNIVINLDAGDCEAAINFPNYGNVQLSGNCFETSLPTTTTISGFAGAFAPANWTLTLNGGDGSVNTAGAPGSVAVISSDNNSTALNTNYSIVIPSTGTLSFNWSYVSTDFDSSWDPFGYSVGTPIASYNRLGLGPIPATLGTFTRLTDNSGTLAQAGAVSIPVTAGQVFSFSQLGDNLGRATTTISNLSLSASTPGANTNCPVTYSVPNGTLFPIGSTPVTATITCNGVTQNCVFNVIVNEHAAQGSLNCNDLAYVSLDEDCSAEITADEVLLGTNYGCYEDYLVELDRTPPYGNGPWTNNLVGLADKDKTYAVRVTFDTDGDGFSDPTENKCWGNVKIEDKLAPIITCINYDVPCNSTDYLNPYITQNVSYTFASTGSVAIPDLGSGSLDLEAAGFPGGTISDINLTVDIDHTFIGDIQLELTSPDGTTGIIYVPNACGSDVLNVTFDDESPNCFNLCADFGSGGSTRTLSCLGPAFTTDDLSIFDGENVSGTWTLFASDNFGFDSGVLNGFSIEVTSTVNNTLPIGGYADGAYDNCMNQSLTYLDTEVNADCASGYTRIISRKWTATDMSGLTGTCIQTIGLYRPTLNDVVLPPDYDDIDAPAFDCTGDYPTPEWIEAQGLQGFPYIFGDIAGCNINYTYEDGNVIEQCDGTYKFVREWTIVDWCVGGGFIYNQLIKVIDDEAPEFVCPADFTVSTDPYQCCAYVDLPNIIITDNCSSIASVRGMITARDFYTGEIINMIPINGTVSVVPNPNPWDPTQYIGNYGLTGCLPRGTHTVSYVVEDDCGNINDVCSFDLTIADYTEPNATCVQFTTVSVGVDDPQDCYLPSEDGCEGAGIAWVKASSLDNGSFDNCGGLKFTIERMAPFNACVQGLNSTSGHPDCNDGIFDFPTELDRAAGTIDNDPFVGADSLKFYCCEVGLGEQMVIFRAFQLNADGTPALGPDGLPIFNSCMVNVTVQDKLRPVCVTPGNITVNCEQFDPTLWPYAYPTIWDNCCLETPATMPSGGSASGLVKPWKPVADRCGLIEQVDYTNFDTVCNRGTILRRFRAYDCHGNTFAACQYTIRVDYEQDYFVKFPADVIATVCAPGNFSGEPTFFGEDCELLATSYEDEIFTVVPDACYKIERTWRVINWCTYDPNRSCVYVPNPNPNAITNHPTNLPGVTVSAPGTAAPWAPTVVAITPGAATTNYSIYWTNAGNAFGPNGLGLTAGTAGQANCYEYKQIIKVIDTQAPSGVPTEPACDINDPVNPLYGFTDNDPGYWNNASEYWWNACEGTHDLCEEPTTLCITATDLCSKENVNIEYQLFLDLDDDGVMETVVSSTNFPPTNTVMFGNAANPGFTGGVARTFDDRFVAANQKYRFAIYEVVDAAADTKTACVRWVNQAQINATSGANGVNTPGILPELPHGSHKIKWFITDGCGNEKIEEVSFEVKDCKPPVIYCQGANVTVMPAPATASNPAGGMIAVWANDVLLSVDDNCTATDEIKYAIRRSGTGTGFPVFPAGHPLAGQPQDSVVFNCDHVGTQFVELWAIDCEGNTDYCETFVNVQNNVGSCTPGSGVSVAGQLKVNESAEGVEDGNVSLAGSHPALPPLSMFDLSDNNGQYNFNAIPVATNYTITPEKDDNPLNGVTTYDLVLISKHILGTEPLDSPYKMISADANKSGSITSFDIVELRKLILGIYDELPNNTSWRFVDKSFAFPNAANPFQTAFPENSTVANAAANNMDDDFAGCKIGDVNNSALANSLMSSDDRTAGTLLFDVEDRQVAAGEEFVVNFKAAEQVQGWQFTMALNGLQVSDIVGNDKVKADNFGVFDGALTTSVEGGSEFAVKFRAEKAGKLSQMLGVSSRITKAEAYASDNSRLDVAFRFDGKTIAGIGFELYQNQPNPFVSKTVVGFHLPEAATATLSVYDESGRLVFTQKGDFAKGNNAISLDRALLNTTGVLYYTLETATDAATKKMIQSK